MAINLTNEQLLFLESQHAPLSKVFDATGMGPSVYKRKMKAGDYYIAMNVTPCD